MKFVWPNSTAAPFPNIHRWNMNWGLRMATSQTGDVTPSEFLEILSGNLKMISPVWSSHEIATCLFPFSENLRNIFLPILFHYFSPTFWSSYPIFQPCNTLLQPQNMFLHRIQKTPGETEKPSTSTRHLPVDWSWNVQNHHQHQRRFEAKHRNHSGPMKPDIRRTSPPNWMGQWPAKLFGESWKSPWKVELRLVFF